MRMCQKHGCHRLYGHGAEHAAWDAAKQQWVPIPSVDAVVPPAEPYTPTTEDVTAAWMHWRHAGETEQERAEALDRWSASRDAQVLRAAAAKVKEQRDAFDEDTQGRKIRANIMHWLGAEADRIAGGTQ